jgi:hypothetical protein
MRSISSSEDGPAAGGHSSSLGVAWVVGMSSTVSHN